MAGKRTARTSTDAARRRTNGGVTSIPMVTRTPSMAAAPYVRDTRWATPVARRRTDVVVVDVARPMSAASSAPNEDPLLLTA
jgi:hypothetical protein